MCARLKQCRKKRELFLTFPTFSSSQNQFHAKSALDLKRDRERDIKTYIKIINTLKTKSNDKSFCFLGSVY